MSSAAAPQSSASFSSSGRKHTVRGSRVHRRHKASASRSHLAASSSSRVRGEHETQGASSSWGAAQNVRVVHNGADVTPHSLLGEKVDLPGGGGGYDAGQSSGRSSPQHSEADLAGLDPRATGVSVGYSATRSRVTGVSNYSDTESVDEPTAPTPTPLEIKVEASPGESAWAKIDEPEEGQLTEEALETMVHLTLSETPTTTLLHLRGVCVGTDSVHHKIVTEENEAYARMVAERAGNDLYSSRHVQTSNPALKTKDVTAAPPPTKDTACQATSWDIHDTWETRAAEGVAALLGDGADLLTVEGKDDHGQHGTTSASTIGGRAVGAHVSRLRRQVDFVVAASLASPGCLLPVEDDQSSGAAARVAAAGMSDAKTSAEGMGGAQIVEEREAAAVMASEKLRSKLRTMELVIQQNAGVAIVYHAKHLRYRAVPSAEDEADTASTAVAVESSGPEGDGVDGAMAADGEGKATESKTTVTEEPFTPGGTAVASISAGAIGSVRQPAVQLLWQYKCAETEGRTVTSVTFNVKSPDLLAVSYGDFDFASQRAGLVAFWTLKNPEFPERVVRVSSGVNSVAFSKSHPSLLAAGCYDGSVLIYDLTASTDGGEMKPVLESSQLASKHKDAVWEVRWVDKKERGGTDGRVTEWSMKKGLSSNDLMVLKRIAMPHKLGGGGEGIISRTASGLSLDFPLGDPAVYFAGTEDGTVHKCSWSYNEQYLETYFGHTGPVYKVQCSPFMHDIFLTCSADWTVKLWNHKEDSPVLSFQSTDLADEVYDIAWSPSCSTIFGSVSGDGRVEVWDLSQSTLDPVITRFIDPGTHGQELSAAQPPPPPGVDAAASTAPGMPKFTCLAFARNAPVLVVGDNRGVVDTYRIAGLENLLKSQEGLDPDEQIVLLKEAIAAK